MKMHDLTGIGRPLDPQYSTNIAVMALSAAVGIGVAVISLLQGQEILPSAVEAFRASVTFFLGWAIAREYDPDHPYSAFLAAAAILAAYLLGYSGNLLFLALLMLLMRYIDRTTGIPATTIDLTAGILLVAWLAWQMDWIVGIIGAGGYAIAALLDKDRNDRFTFMGIALLVALISLLWGPSRAGFTGINVQVIGLSIAFVVIALPLYLSYHEVHSQCDLTDEPLQPSRVRWTQIFYLVSTLMIGLKLGTADSGDMLAAGSVIVATGFYYLLQAVLPANRPSNP